MFVIYQTTEDDADDTIVPRFIRANGDCEKLIFIDEPLDCSSYKTGRPDTKTQEARPYVEAVQRFPEVVKSFIESGSAISLLRLFGGRRCDRLHRKALGARSEESCRKADSAFGIDAPFEGSHIEPAPVVKTGKEELR